MSVVDTYSSYTGEKMEMQMKKQFEIFKISII